MAEGPKQSDSTPERRLPTKAQIQAAAYGNKPSPSKLESLPEALPQAPASAPAAPEADRWIIAATRADGWDIYGCDQVLRGCQIETQLVESGIPSVRVRRSDYSAATRKLQERKSQLWSRPSGGANIIVSVAFVIMLGLMVLGGVMVTGVLNQGRGEDDTKDIALFAIVIPVMVLAVFGILTAFRRR